MSVDVLLPFYGDALLMRVAVGSIINQTYPDWTLTIIDDGTPDPSMPQWSAAIVASDPRIRYVRNETNLGANGNYRKALTFVTHELAVVMGADDIMLPRYLETIVAAHTAYPDASIIQPGVQVIDEHGVCRSGTADAIKKVLTPRGHGPRLLRGEPLAVSLMRGNWLYFPSITWRSDALLRTGFREGFNVVQDLALAMDIIKAGGSFVLDDTVCFQYRRHSASDSSVRALDGSRFVEEAAYFAQEAEAFEALGWPAAARAARRHLTSRLNAATLWPKAIRAKNTSGARTLLRHAVSRSGGPPR